MIASYERQGLTYTDVRTIIIVFTCIEEINVLELGHGQLSGTTTDKPEHLREGTLGDSHATREGEGGERRAPLMSFGAVRGSRLQTSSERRARLPDWLGAVQLIFRQELWRNNRIVVHDGKTKVCASAVQVMGHYRAAEHRA